MSRQVGKSKCWFILLDSRQLLQSLPNDDLLDHKKRSQDHNMWLRKMKKTIINNNLQNFISYGNNWGCEHAFPMWILTIQAIANSRWWPTSKFFNSPCSFQSSVLEQIGRFESFFTLARLSMAQLCIRNSVMNATNRSVAAAFHDNTPCHQLYRHQIPYDTKYRKLKIKSQTSNKELWKETQVKLRECLTAKIARITHFTISFWKWIWRTLPFIIQAAVLNFAGQEKSPNISVILTVN